jgi:hypothetical protein
MATETQDKAEAVREPGELTGALTLHDVLRHLVQHGPARNDAERAELLGVIDSDDPGYTEPEHVMTDAEKAAEYDRLQAGKPVATEEALA